MPDDFVRAWRDAWPNVQPPRCFTRGRLTALVSRELYEDDSWRWHISVRYGEVGEDGRVPTWDELVTAVHALRPGVGFTVGIPPENLWMSVHPHVLHAIEVRDPGLVAHWHANAMGSR